MLFESILCAALLLCLLALLAGTLLGLNRKPQLFARPHPVMQGIKALLPVLAVVFVLRSFVFEAFRIPSGSMQPTLVEGDLVLVDKFSYGLRLPILGTRLTHSGVPARGDIVVFRGQIKGRTVGVIKRIVGLPGDHIRYNNKTLYINGTAATQAFTDAQVAVNQHGHAFPSIERTESLAGRTHAITLHPTESNPEYPYAEVTVPENSYFVMGDCRDNSRDSRFWGVIKDEAIVGKAQVIWMSLNFNHGQWFKLDRLKQTIRWGRVGKLT